MGRGSNPCFCRKIQDGDEGSENCALFVSYMLSQLDVVRDQGIDCAQLLHAIIDDLCGQRGSILPFESKPELVAVIQSYKTFIAKAAGNGSSKNAISDALQEAKVSGPVVSLIVDVVESRKDELVGALKDKVTQLAPSYLQDFDWSLRLVLSSDRISVLREPRLLLTLHLVDCVGAVTSRREVHVELSKSELDRLLQSCDDVNQVVQRLRI